MKVLALFVFFVLRIFEVHSQGFAIGATYNNFFYKGLNNQLKIAVENYANSELAFEVSHGKIFYKEGYYYYYTDSLSQCIISVYRRKKNKLREIGSHSFRIKQIPNPRFSFGGYENNDTISVGRLKINDRVYTRLYNFDPTSPYYKIDSFRVLIFEKKFKEPKIYFNKSNFLSTEIINAFQKLNSGAKIEFDKIYARIIGDDRNLITNKGEILHLEPTIIFVR